MGTDTIAVLGPGGVGGLLAALLARAGTPVVCLAGPATAATLRESGMTLTSGRYGEFTVPVRAATRLAEPVAACLVTVKATTLPAALDRVPPAALGDALVVPMLNGLDHMAALRRRYPADQVIAGTIQVESARVAPGRIAHASPFARIALASATAAPDRIQALAGWLRAAGLDVAVRGDETAVLWHKLAFLAPLALLTTHAQAPVGAVRAGRAGELRAVIDEVAAVAAAAGAPVDTGTLAGMFASVPAEMTSSMRRDAAAGQPIELDAIGGAVLRAAARYGVAVPVIARLVADLADRYPPAAGSGPAAPAGERG